MNQQGVMTTLECAPVPVQHNYKHTCVSRTAQTNLFQLPLRPKKKTRQGEAFLFLYLVSIQLRQLLLFLHTQTKMLYNIYIFSSSAMLRDELLFFFISLLRQSASLSSTSHRYHTFILLHYQLPLWGGETS